MPKIAHITCYQECFFGLKNKNIMNILIGFCVAITITLLSFLVFEALGIIEQTKYLVGWWSACGYIYFSRKYRKV